MNRLLTEHDAPPLVRVNGESKTALLLVGDHAGSAIPSALGTLGLSAADQQRHIALDIGIKALGTQLSNLLDATFVHQHYSRLVIDSNRDPQTDDAMPLRSDQTYVSGNADLSPLHKEQRRTEIHEPYQQAIAHELALRVARGQTPVLVSLHSFTPKLGSDERIWHVGVLHDAGNTELSAALLTVLADERGVTVGDNQPYRMNSIDHTVPRHAYPHGIPYLEMEFRQDLLQTADGPQHWAGWFADCLARAAQAAGISL